jgi:hypothetical protein
MNRGTKKGGLFGKEVLNGQSRTKAAFQNAGLLKVPRLRSAEGIPEEIWHLPHMF